MVRIFLANHMVGFFLANHMVGFFLANHVVGLFKHYALIRSVSSQSYCYIVSTLCSYSSNFQPIILLDLSYVLLLFVQFLANHIVRLFLCCALIRPISSQSYCRIVLMLCSYSSNFQPIILSDCSYVMLLSNCTKPLQTDNQPSEKEKVKINCTQSAIKLKNFLQYHELQFKIIILKLKLFFINYKIVLYLNFI